MKKKCPLAAKHVQPLPCACKKHYMHTHCSHLLLDRYEIEAEDRPTDPSITFCTKGCHTKWNGDKIRAAKAADKAASDAAKPPKKVPWDSDGTLDFLMDWITTEPNYALYCGCNGNKGKSKAQHHKELSIEMKKELPGTDRSEKCIEAKIGRWIASLPHAAMNPDASILIVSCYDDAIL